MFQDRIGFTDPGGVHFNAANVDPWVPGEIKGIAPGSRAKIQNSPRVIGQDLGENQPRPKTPGQIHKPEEPNIETLPEPPGRTEGVFRAKRPREPLTSIMIFYFGHRFFRLAEQVIWGKEIVIRY